MWNKGFSHQFWITGIDLTADGTIYPTGGLFRNKAMRNTYRRLFLIPRASSPLTWVSTQSKLLLMAPSKDRAATLGFRCVVATAE
jgi:hypothetical protein